MDASGHTVAVPKNICVIGLGYIGLPTAVLLANQGFEVIGVDINQQIVKDIQDGKPHIVEPDLEMFLRAAIQSGRFRVSTKPAAADVHIICVPTPLQDVSEGIPQPDLEHVKAAARALAPLLSKGNLVVLESTCSVGTTEKLHAWLKQDAVPVDAVDIAYCPERVFPGSIFKELVENDRIVGGLTSQATQRAQAFYQQFVQGRVYTTSSRTAEMVKLAENSYRDVNIAFANELSMLCHNAGVNTWELIELANCHPRVQILQPGVGVGGHCIAIDPWFLAAVQPEHAVLVRAARMVNNAKANWTVEQILQSAQAWQAKWEKPPIIACLGLTFKPNVDDTRESPALEIVQQLHAHDLQLMPADPHLKETQAQQHNLQLFSWEEAVQKADILCMLVAHRAFQPLINLRQHTAASLVLDFCGALRKNIA